MDSATPTIRSDAAHGHRPGLTGTDEGLAVRERLLAVQEAGLIRHFEEQRQLHQEEESRLDRHAAVLARERARFVQEHQARMAELERSAELLRLERRRLEIDCQRLDARTGHVHPGGSDRNPGALSAHATPSPSTSPGNVELEAAWAELAQQAYAARVHREAEEREIQQQWQSLECERRRLQQLELAWHEENDRSRAIHRARLEELEGLEVRIRHYHTKVRALREEAASLETRLCTAPPSIAGDGGGEPAKMATLVHPRFQGDIQGFLTRVVEQLADQCDALSEQHAAIARIRRSWDDEWNAALNEIGERDQELKLRESVLGPRERTLALAENVVQVRDRELTRLGTQFQCWEARLCLQQSALRFQRRRLLAYIKARSQAVREQQQMLFALRENWERLWAVQIEQARRSRDQAENARRDYFRLRELYRQRLSELEDRHRVLAERELVLQQIHQSVLGGQADPVQAEREIQRRTQAWARLAARPMRGVRRQRKELERRTAHLEAYRRYLLQSQHKLDDDRSRCSTLLTRLQADESAIKSERSRWIKEAQAWREERARLLDHTRDLQEQIDRLALLLADSGPPDPSLALCAAG